MNGTRMKTSTLPRAGTLILWSDAQAEIGPGNYKMEAQMTKKESR